ncbi:helicase [Shewanella putrefaciens]|nr:helicase [Shewanella putrefaciens]
MTRSRQSTTQASVVKPLASNGSVSVSRLSTEVQRAFLQGGVLSTHIQGFSARESQMQMAQGVSEAIASKGNLVIEAGTGLEKPLPI